MIGAIVNTNSKATTLYTDFTKQGFIDGSCQVTQNTATISLTNSYKWGTVDLVQMKADGTVGGGNINQGASIGANLTSARFSSITLTGAGAVYAAKYIESKNSKKYKNAKCSIQFKITHNIGSAKNAYIIVNKCSLYDNFSSVNNISTSAAISIPSGTETLVKFENVSMGDCSPGLQIEFKLDCGAVTSKTIEMTDFQINIGSTCLQYSYKSYEQELWDCQYQYWVNKYDSLVSDGNYKFLATGLSPTTTTATFFMQLPRKMRLAVVPTFSAANTFAAYNGSIIALTGITADQPGSTGFNMNCTVASGLIANGAVFLICNNFAATQIVHDARLGV